MEIYFQVINISSTAEHISMKRKELKEIWLSKLKNDYCLPNTEQKGVWREVKLAHVSHLVLYNVIQYGGKTNGIILIKKGKKINKSTSYASHTRTSHVFGHNLHM